MTVSEKEGLASQRKKAGALTSVKLMTWKSRLGGRKCSDCATTELLLPWPLVDIFCTVHDDDDDAQQQ